MKTIQTLRLPYLVITSYYEFHLFNENLLRRSKPQILHVEELFYAYKEYISQLERVVLVPGYRPLINSLKVSACERELMIRRLFRTVKRLVDAPGSDPSEENKALWDILSPYRGLEKKGMKEENRLIGAMICELKAAGAQPLIDQLLGKNFFALLEVMNVYFLREADRCINEKAQKDQVDTRELCKKIDGIYQEICDTINRRAKTNPGRAIEKFISDHNALVCSYSHSAGQ